MFKFDIVNEAEIIAAILVKFNTISNPLFLEQILKPGKHNQYKLSIASKKPKSLDLKGCQILMSDEFPPMAWHITFKNRPFSKVIVADVARLSWSP